LTETRNPLRPAATSTDKTRPGDEGDLQSDVKQEKSTSNMDNFGNEIYAGPPELSTRRERPTG